MPNMSFRHVLCLGFAISLGACVNSVPTAEKLDQLEQQVRAEYRQEYVALDEQRRSGGMDQVEYNAAKKQIDQRVQNRVDTMAWSRHALVQSDMKANAIPTPDKPQSNLPPGVGSMQGTVYNSTRQNGIGTQAIGNMIQQSNATTYNGRRAGTMYDEQ
jgi:hypothetical protein